MSLFASTCWAALAALVYYLVSQRVIALRWRREDQERRWREELKRNYQEQRRLDREIAQCDAQIRWSRFMDAIERAKRNEAQRKEEQERMDRLNFTLANLAKISERIAREMEDKP